VRQVPCKGVGRPSWVSVEQRAGLCDAASPFGVFQERHAAEVRRNKELQVELSG